MTLVHTRIKHEKRSTTHMNDNEIFSDDLPYHLTGGNDLSLFFQHCCWQHCLDRYCFAKQLLALPSSVRSCQWCACVCVWCSGLREFTTYMCIFGWVPSCFFFYFGSWKHYYTFNSVIVQHPIWGATPSQWVNEWISLYVCERVSEYIYTCMIKMICIHFMNRSVILLCVLCSISIQLLLPLLAC